MTKSINIFVFWPHITVNPFNKSRIQWISVPRAINEGAERKTFWCGHKLPKKNLGNDLKER